ncbi:hypothetical protein Pyn_05834 [Prunus yedoensis var. nudiflora]|uniref:pyruvate decarboxylase n=1 Tax=Prunus yedoensis var. nudiflora TaxID=2094558 RepID=A0A314Z7E3_PRUYE|nr:hypothetical protein Pyn_05834 [Prunus yedoensis var. nudiflora]
MDAKIGALDVCKPASNEVGSLPNGTAMAIQNSVPSTVINSSEATLGRHLARRLVQIGVTDVFTVPGDFNLTLSTTSSQSLGSPTLAAATSSTPATPLMATLALVASALGGPNSNDYGTNRILHHTIGLPDFTQELRCFQTVTCYQAVVNNLEDAHESIDTAISTALKESKPVYISISCNLAGIPHPTFSREPVPFSLSPKLSNQLGLEAAVEAAAEFLNKAVKPVMVTAQDVSTMIRNGQRTIIFLINNGGYTIEVEIHDGPYNVIKNWNYTGLVDAIHNGEGKCWTTKVRYEEELIEAIETATGDKKDSFCFIEVIVHKDDTSKELLEWGSRVSAANSRPPNPQ